MFATLSEKFQKLFSSLAGNKKLTEDNISSSVREMRLALLDADVSYNVVSKLIHRVQEKAIGEKLIKSIKPREQFIKIVHEELIRIMGIEEKELNLVKRPALIMMCGLQGSGKTTHTAKLGYFLKNKEKKVLLVGCDLQRPAAIEQLKKIAEENCLDVFSEGSTPLNVAKNAYQKAIREKYDVLIVDTAGRLHINEELMTELYQIRKELPFSEVLFIANATTGQDAIKTAFKFDKKIQITGSILSMLDGDARAGAAISIKEITQKPILFEGIGEKIEDLQVFNPSSMADRILGRGDIINLVRRAEKSVDEKKAHELKKKIKKASFTFEDYLKQMQMIQKMGSMKSLLRMVPGMSSMVKNVELPEKEMNKTKAMITSMTLEEKRQEVELIHNRRLRIAKGSGCKLDDVNKLIKGFKRIKQLLKHMPKKGFMPDMQKMMGGL